MALFLARRLLAAGFTMFLATVLVFTMARLTGDPREQFLTVETTQENWDAWGKKFGLDKPLPVQYLVWLGNSARLDMGTSLNQARPVWDLIQDRLWPTIELALTGWFLSIAIGVPLGVLSAVKRGTAADYLARTLAMLGQALPPFWLGLILILIFAVELQWLPAGTRGGFSNLIMPAMTLALINTASNLRITRSAMLEVLDSEYVKMARAKGVSPKWVIWKHAFRNAAIAPLTNAGLLLAGFLAGTVVTETVFAWPGLGRLAVDAVRTNDFPVISGLTLVFTAIYVSANFLIDLSYGFVDPRIRLG
ncbi:MAG: ABC transporter permease [Chloroflexi bacterium]|nr:ABC transporter permease [Chloroflexota bacterium]